MKISCLMLRKSTGERFPVYSIERADSKLRISGKGEIHCDDPEDFILQHPSGLVHFKSALRGADEWIGDPDHDAWITA